MKRTAVVHAAREGNANVASYLLHRGANPNAADSSGNTAMHYAAAYGNYFCVKALLAASADPDPANDWKVSTFIFVIISKFTSHDHIVWSGAFIIYYK